MISNFKILTVDDDFNLCKTMNMILSKKGYDVSIANNGFEAIEKVKQKHFDLILMDIKMPGLDGVESFKRIKQIDPESLVIMTTAYAVEDRISEAVSEGAFGVMYKPLDIEQILSILSEFKSHTSKESVLVIDDETGIAELIKRILEKDGYRVNTADSGENALDVSRNTYYDIFIIDMKMSGINGYETMIALKKRFPDSVYIFMTGYREELSNMVQDSLKSGAFTCLYKPFQLIDVLSAVKDGLHLKRINQSSQQKE